MVHQFNLFLLLFGALQGGLLSLWLLKNRRKESAHLYLGLFLLVAGLQLTLKVITKVWLMHHVRFLYLLSYQLPYLVGPLLFLYAKVRRNGRFRRVDWLHFIPFGLAVLSAGMVYSKLWGEAHPYATATWQTLSLGVYSWLAYRLADSSTKAFLRIATTAELIIILTLAVMVMYHSRFPDARLLFIVLTLLIYWVSYQLIAKSEPFSPANLPTTAPLLQKTPKYAHSSLKAEEADRIEQLLRQMMHQDKLFLDASITIDTLSEKLSTSRHHLSQVLNERLHQSYADYMNALRLEEARQRLSNPAYFRYTIASIAFDSGFNSVASFNEVFRKHYGTTPSKFREPFMKKMSA